VIEALFLDAGGVLLLPRIEEVREVLGIDPEQHRRAHHAGMAALDAEPRANVYWPAFAAAVGRRPDAGLVARLSRIRWTTVITESVLALRDLARRDLRLAVVSNSDGTVEHDLLEFAVCQAGGGQGTEVAAVLDSTVVGVEKPDPRIFELALEKVGGVDPGRALHVGDSVHFDVGGARSAGVRPVHLDPFEMCSAGDHEHVRSLAELDALL
jgi:putative hydrolase of the HAD superfamily